MKINIIKVKSKTTQYAVNENEFQDHKSYDDEQINKKAYQIKIKLQ